MVVVTYTKQSSVILYELCFAFLIYQTRIFLKSIYLNNYINRKIKPYEKLIKLRYLEEDTVESSYWNILIQSTGISETISQI